MTHKLIRAVADYDGFAPDEAVDHDKFVFTEGYKMVLNDVATRVEALQRLDAAIEADDGGLRERSELVDLRRRLGRIHSDMLKANR